jgi:hypothetical protein
LVFEKIFFKILLCPFLIFKRDKRLNFLINFITKI